MSSVNMPRLRKGYRITGPDAYGCFNTGFAPCVRYTTLTPPLLLVGHEDEVQDKRTLRRAIVAKGKRSVLGPSGRKVYVYHTTTGARRRFKAMCDKAIAFNRAEAEHVRGLRDKARAGDLGAALDLGIDYGLGV